MNGLSVGANVYGNVSGSVYVPGDAAGLQSDPAAMQLPPGMSNTEMTYTADNRLATYNGNAVMYDQDGNMITGPLAGSMQSYSYDARNRLMEAGGISYGYNSENVRTSVTENGVTTRYVVNPQAVLSQVLMETDGQGNRAAYYVYGLGLIGREAADGSYATYHYDRRGSTVALTNDNGVITDTYEYGPYGEQIRHRGTMEQPFQYNGRDGVATDANGLYHMRARYYNPEIKRFINRDVLTGSISDSQTLNRYAYVNGNPISYVDPFGLSRDGDSAWLQGGSFLADLVPWVGTVKGFQQAFTGNNYITGEHLSAGDRWGEGIGATLSIIPIPGLKHAGKYGTKGVIWAGSKLKSRFFARGTGYVQTGGRELSVDAYLKRLDAAGAMYDSFRKSNVDIQSISQNTGMSVNRIRRIKDHLFFKEHIKEHGVGRFEADYEIAQAWDRLQKGSFKPQDIDLLNHELFESKFEGIFKTDYRTAHDRTVDSGRPWYPHEED